MTKDHNSRRDLGRFIRYLCGRKDEDADEEEAHQSGWKQLGTQGQIHGARLGQIWQQNRAIKRRRQREHVEYKPEADRH